MARNWLKGPQLNSQYGSPPAVDELEVSLFGPGFGEAVAAHLGEQAWLLVDSCIDPESGRPATLEYLDSIGVPRKAVRVLVASHWHDDHVRGLADLLHACPNAELQVSSVFRDEEARAFLSTYSGEAAPLLARGTTELFKACRGRERLPFVSQRSNVIDLLLPSLSERVQVTALSPTPSACSATLARMAAYIPTVGDETAIEHAPELSPNEEAVALHIAWGKDAALLGSDVEGTSRYGWADVTADSWCKARTRAALYKVAHHGSKSGDHPTIWSVLLEPKPVAALTPFTLGRHRLPTNADKARLKAQSGSVHITSGASRKPDLSHEHIKRLNQICTGLARANAGFGAVRFRKRRGQPNWRVEYFGDASQL